jgi:putative sigma-54 modulation protein
LEDAVKITYTGKPEALTPAENRKIEQRFEKLSKLLDSKRCEAEVHVIVAGQRHLLRAEIKVQYRDHPLFCEASAADVFTAITDAADKLEKQILKLRTKWRDTKRGPKEEPEEEVPVAAAPAPAREQKRAAQPAPARTPAKKAAKPEPEPETEAETAAGPQVLRVNHHERRKPMTVDEAMIEIDTRDYVVYRDADTGRTSVLIRRRDGDYDLIEA